MELLFGLFWIAIAIFCFIEVHRENTKWKDRILDLALIIFVFVYGCVLIYVGIYTLIH